MKISTKLQLSSIAISSMVVVFVGASLVLVFTLQQSHQRQLLAQKITETSFQLALLRSEYVAHPSERPKTQWINTYEVQARLLGEAAPLFQKPDEKALFEDTRKVSTDSAVLFGELNQKIEQGASQTIIEELNNQLTLKAQARVSDILKLSELSQADTLANEHLFEIVVIVLGLLIDLIMAWSYGVSRSISQSLHTLQEGTKLIADGNLDQQIVVKSHDEFGALGSLFNAMTAKLKESYGSLEQRVRDRTKDLENAQIATRNVLEDIQVEKISLNIAKAKDEAMLGSIGDGVVAVDHEGKIVLMNKAFEDMTGQKAGEVQGKAFVDVVPMFDEKGELISPEARPITRALKSGHTTTTTTTIYSFKRKNGTMIPIAINVTPYFLNNKLIGAVEVFRDITEEKAIDKAKSEFVSIASHQLRTPLGIMKWYLETLGNEDYLKKAPMVIRQYFDEIQKSNERVLSLVRDLLSVSRIDQGRVKNAPKSIDPLQFVADIVEQMQIVARKKKVALRITIKNQKIPSITIDDLRFHEVIENLIANAIEYTAGGGSVDVIEQKHGDTLLIRIKDSGIGISASDQKKIFTKFFRSEKAVGQNPEGSGLGLYLVKSYVEGWGGTVSTQSVEGAGSTFTVSLPMIKKRVYNKGGEKS